MNPSGLEDIIALFADFIPHNTVLTIEESRSKIMPKYVYRLTYTSKNSGRTMCMVSKGDLLPNGYDDIFFFHKRQLVLTPQDTAREFSRIYFLERRARQEAFLRGELGNIRVSGKTTHKGEQDGAVVEDRLSFKDYA